MRRRSAQADEPKDGQEDVDEEVGAAAALKEDTERGEEDGENDLADLQGRQGARRRVVRFWAWLAAALSETSGPAGARPPRKVWKGGTYVGSGDGHLGELKLR